MMSPRLIVVLLALLPANAGQSGNPPDDPLFPQQTSFHASAGPALLRLSSSSTRVRSVTVAPGVTLDLPRAWSISTGSRAVVVALLDDGFPYAHDDLADNIWQNRGEMGVDSAGLPKAANGRDDDANGFVDDVVGYDFAFDDPDPDPYVFDGMDRSRVQPYLHAVDAMGIIGAVGNNGRGIAGINWQVSLMLLKIGAQGESRTAGDTMRAIRAARAIRYAADNGARIINWSGYVRDTSTRRIALLREAVRYAGEHDVLFVAGAGNDALDNDVDANCLYPQCIDGPAVMRVAELEFDGTLVRYETGGQWRGSNYGARRVEIAAIGQNFTTTVRHAQSTYRLTAGTSNAGPVVAGVAALMLSVNPRLRPAEIRSILMETATRLPALEGRVASGGTVNAYRAVAAARDRR